jgi:hypothetical protein
VCDEVVLKELVREREKSMSPWQNIKQLLSNPSQNFGQVAVFGRNHQKKKSKIENQNALHPQIFESQNAPPPLGVGGLLEH